MPVNSDHTRERERLRAVSADLRHTLHSHAAPDQQAYAALTADGAVRPWTEAAEHLWQAARGPDSWRRHHLAVLCHARAYDLEQAGDDAAFRYWEKALEHWNAVIDDDAFWADLATGLPDRMGVAVEPDIVAGARTRLPRDLLAPHLDLAVAYLSSEPNRARRHVEVIKASGFDPALIDEVRADLVKDVVDSVPGAVRTASFDEMLAELGRWLAVDSDNPALVQATLFVHRKKSERVSNEPEGLSRLALQLEAAERELRPVLDRMPPPSGRLAQELARYEFWRGASKWRRASDTFEYEAPASVLRSVTQECAKSIALIQHASVLDPTLVLDSFYNDVARFEALAEELWGMCLLVSGRPGGGADVVGSAQHLRSAIRLRPDSFQTHALLVQALLGTEPLNNSVVAEATRVAAKAGSLVESQDDRDAHNQLMLHLAAARRWLS